MNGFGLYSAWGISFQSTTDLNETFKDPWDKKLPVQMDFEKNEEYKQKLFEIIDFGLATYKKNVVALKRIHKTQILLTRNVRKELKLVNSSMAG